MPARSLVPIMLPRRATGITQMSDFSIFLNGSTVCYARGALIEWTESPMGAEIVTKTVTFERSVLPQKLRVSNVEGLRGGPGALARRGAGV